MSRNPRSSVEELSQRTVCRVAVGLSLALIGNASGTSWFFSLVSCAEAFSIRRREGSPLTFAADGVIMDRDYGY